MSRGWGGERLGQCPRSPTTPPSDRLAWLGARPAAAAGGGLTAPSTRTVVAVVQHDSVAGRDDLAQDRGGGANRSAYRATPHPRRARSQHATAVLRTRYPDFTPPEGLTVLVEIIYPANRIVLDYDGLDDLILLGAVDIATGRTFGPEAVPGWPGPVVDAFAYATLAEALAAPPRDNREGLVVHFTGPDTRVKIKYAEYVRLHRIVTGLNARIVWEAPRWTARPGRAARAAARRVPRLGDGVAAGLTDRGRGARAAAVEAAFAAIVAALPEGWGRKEFALAVVAAPTAERLFLRLDGKDYRRLLWQQVRPEQADPARTEIR